MTEGFWLRIGAVWGFLAVATGAFGAHGLKERLEATGQLANFQTGAQYHMYMALALVTVGLLQLSGRSGPALSVAGWAFLVGSMIFSGTLYALGVSGQRWLGAITPIGGVLILVGWAALAVAAGPAGARPAPVQVSSDREPVASASINSSR
ncbi:DUF423 domain-containing protein [Planctomyces sp. SH-PL62]|uniref:DUF423 domain-containing protein n=1 Tax=Planctomyces sp. SH-PL62 TaxID=1636152 RepID=UPI00078B4154|nr:DUF423 domain-containing protein [Planctomyces sp. SH-PL62]AMV38852.1 hypothetical protein VT85_15565 [Planctomyces sp. SH-PL62]